MPREKSLKTILKSADQAFKAAHYSQVVHLLSGIDIGAVDPKKRPEVLFWQAVSLHETGNPGQAVEKIKEALKLKPHFAEALDAWGSFLAEEGKIYSAISKYRLAARVDPNYWQTFFHWGYLLKRMGSPKAALRKFRDVLEKNEDHLETYIHAGDCVFQMGHYDKAIPFYDLALQKGGDASEINLRIGNSEFALGRHEEALAAYKKCLRLDPLDGSAYENWGLLLQQEGKIEEAARKFEEGLLRSPEHPTLLLRHGGILLQLEKFKEALIPLQKSHKLLMEKMEGDWGIQWVPVAADCAYSLGSAHRRLGNATEARERLMEALRYSPNHINALQELAMLRGVYREHHVAWEFIMEGTAQSQNGPVRGLRAYRVAALDFDEALQYAKECEEDIVQSVKAKDITQKEQVATYAGVLARGQLFLLAQSK